MPEWTLKADLERVTVADMEPVQYGLGQGRFGALPKALALIVAECPAEWGAPNDPNTYAQFPVFSETTKALRDFYVKTIQAPQKLIEGVEFDLSAIKAEEYDRLMEQARLIDVRVCIRLLRLLMRKCPLMADPQDEAAYQQLKFFTEFRPLVTQMMNSASEQMRNFLNPSGAT